MVSGNQQIENAFLLILFFSCLQGHIQCMVNESHYIIPENRCDN